MVVLREELEVDTPLENAFAFVGDFVNSTAWDPGVADARNVTGEPVGVGTRYELTVLFGGRRLPMTYEVTVFDPPNRVVLRGTGSTVDAGAPDKFALEFCCMAMGCGRSYRAVM